MRVVLSVRTICYIYLVYTYTYLYLPQTLLNTRKQRVTKRLFIIQVYIASVLNGPSELALLQGEHENFDRFQKVYMPIKMYVYIPSLYRAILNILLRMSMYIICNICINNIELAYKDEIFSPKVKHVFRE